MTYEVKGYRRRNLVSWLALITLASVLGIGSRHYAYLSPGYIAAYAGDTLWALAVFLGFGLILPRLSTWRVSVLALMFSVLIELSHLYHAHWINSIRRTTLGGLILGFDFVWSDLVCYAAGVGIGVFIEMLWRCEFRSQEEV